MYIPLQHKLWIKVKLQEKCQYWIFIQELRAHDSHSLWRILTGTSTSSNPVPQHKLPYCVVYRAQIITIPLKVFEPPC